MRSTEFVNITSEESDCLPDPKNFSKWNCLMRSTAYVVRLKNNMLAKISKRNPAVVTVKGFLTLEETKNAEEIWIRKIQDREFTVEMLALKSGKVVSKKSKLYTLSPFLDGNGIIRLGGRIENAYVDYSVKFPAILHANHIVTKMIIKHYHEAFLHANFEMVANEIRQKLWIIKSKAAIKSVIKDCLVCKLRKAKQTPLSQEMGQLPKARVSKGLSPFTGCGMDYFGPIEIKIGRRVEKRYGVLFTCMAIRAIHIELVTSLESDKTIMAIRRMSARRGQPLEIYSDNGTNLVGADREMKLLIRQIDDNTIREKLLESGIDWHFNPPAAPHHGGCWERLIGSVKTALKSILKETRPSEELLYTLLTEVENMVNSRPLTKVSEDPESLEALTPNHFLLGSSKGLKSIGEFNDRDLYSRKQYRKGQRLMDHFWKRWTREYLPSLAKRTKWHEKKESLLVGDVVYLADALHRNEWVIGRVENIYPGRDGKVRVVDIRTSTGIYKRPIVKVCKLPIDDTR